MDINLSFLAGFSSITLATILFFAMLAAFLFGSRFSDRERTTSSFGPVESAMLGLLALLLAFTFGLAAQRYDARRQVVVDEANNIGTAILRSDLYSPEERSSFRADFKEYVEARIAFYEAGTDRQKIADSLAKASELQMRLWARASRLGQNRENIIPSAQMVPALNAVIDIVTTRNAAGLANIPDSIIWTIFLLCVISTFTVGFTHGETKPWWVGVSVFIAGLTIAVFLILDLDRPRHGLITLEAPNQNIIALRKMFDTP